MRMVLDDNFIAYKLHRMKQNGYCFFSKRMLEGMVFLSYLICAELATPAYKRMLYFLEFAKTEPGPASSNHFVLYTPLPSQPKIMSVTEVPSLLYSILNDYDDNSFNMEALSHE